MDEHAFAHAYVAHQDRGFLNVLYEDELSFGAGEVFFAAELVISLFHFGVDD